MCPTKSLMSIYPPEYTEEESLLPSCEDLINGVQPKSDSSYLPSYPCTACWNKDPNTTTRPGEHCFACSVRTSFSPQAFRRRNSNGTVPTAYSDNYRRDNDPLPRRASLVTLTEGLNSPSLFYPRPVHQSPLMCPTSDSGYLSPVYLSHPSPYQTIPAWSDGSRTPSNTISASKQATNDRHKLSEKHRRDANGAFVQVGEILRSGINVGIIAGCEICINDERSKMATPSASSSFNSRLASPPADVPAYKSKKPKNDKVQGSLMFQYSYLLHHCPERLGERLQGIREYAADLVNEKKYRLSKATNETTTRKWSDDKRADVVEEALKVMTEQASAHGYDFMESQPSPRKRRRKSDSDCDESSTDERVREHNGINNLSAPTPPSSSGSPTIKVMLSRPVSPLSSGDERVDR